MLIATSLENGFQAVNCQPTVSVIPLKLKWSHFSINSSSGEQKNLITYSQSNHRLRVSDMVWHITLHHPLSLSLQRDLTHLLRLQVHIYSGHEMPHIIQVYTSVHTNFQSLNMCTCCDSLRRFRYMGQSISRNNFAWCDHVTTKTSIMGGFVTFSFQDLHTRS